ncbi:MAG: ABC transporter permease [Bacteroidaceae bacterium]|nr:ABC transporter permease [Bacteroidaceae bacterium]
MNYHYIKVAIRNLWKYKVNTLISWMCLAIGITCFCMTGLMMKVINGFLYEYPAYERRVQIFYINNLEQLKRLEEQHLSAFELLSYHSFSSQDEVIAINGDGKELPLIAWKKNVSSNHFDYQNIRLRYNHPLETPDEVVISASFAKKAFGKVNPIGLTIRQGKDPKGYRIVDIAEEDKFQSIDIADIYFSTATDPNGFLMAEAILNENISQAEANKQLEQIHIPQGAKTIHPTAFLKTNKSQEERLTGILVHVIGILILLSGLINFLKFIIQSFYNRQRELAIRKCMGSSTLNLLGLLLAEIFCMLTASALLSFLISEVTFKYISSNPQLTNLLGLDINTDIMLMVYGMQCRIYFILLCICLLIALFPVYRLRRASIIHFVRQRNGKHLFRNIMIGIQLAVSMFFLGSTFVAYLYVQERNSLIYNPLSKEEKERTIFFQIDNSYLQKNQEAIISEIRELPNISEYCSIDKYRGIELNDSIGQRYSLDIIYADTRYVDFFHIPVNNQTSSADLESGIYISEMTQKFLNSNELNNGRITLPEQTLDIAGIIPGTYNYDSHGIRQAGSALVITPEGNYIHYFRITPHADMASTIQEMKDIIGKYVPLTLPLKLYPLTDPMTNPMRIFEVIGELAFIFAFISILLVVLSIHSAISLDTQNRQKEVAIRKINGATPRNIAYLFGKNYALILISAFVIVYPLGRLLTTHVLSLNAGYRWDWPILLFLCISALVIAVTAYKIREIMHINPATIIKKE